VNGQPVGLREIDGNEIDFRFYRSGDKVAVPRQAVDFRIDQDCAI
jgi:hypothetical protein